MVSAFTLALSELLDPRLRRALISSLLGAALVLVVLAAGLGVLVHHAASFDSWLLDRALELLGDFAILALVWLLFPAVVTLVLGFFLEGAISAVEARRYPGLPPVRRQGVGEMLRAGLRITLFSIAVNLLALPLYLLLPGVNLVVFYGLNGWLLGREYFELVALRRLDERQLLLAWRAHWGLLVASGAVIAFLLTVPFVNLVAPLIAALFMLHLFEHLRQREGSALASR